MLMRPIVETKTGPVRGLIENFSGTEGYSFRGIPYAADTSGDNRWRAPQDVGKKDIDRMEVYDLLRDHKFYGN